MGNNTERGLTIHFDNTDTDKFKKLTQIDQEQIVFDAIRLTMHDWRINDVTQSPLPKEKDIMDTIKLESWNPNNPRSTDKIIIQTNDFLSSLTEEEINDFLIDVEEYMKTILNERYND